MNIYIDGADGTFKSTVCGLIRKTGYNLMSLENNAEKSFIGYLRINYLLNTVCDRTMIAPYVYDEIGMNDGYCPNRLELRSLIRIYKGTGEIFILTGHNEVLKERLIKRGDEPELIIDNIDRINSKYIDLALENDLNVIDTTGLTPEEVAYEILRRCNK